MSKQKIAIIGSGISGMTSAYYLQHDADITVFEKSNRLGGHTATVDVCVDGREYAIDTGFIVYNERSYPNFIRLLTHLGVAVKPTTMGFSVSSRVDGLEYSGAGIAALFAQKRNVFRWSHWRMIIDILRFNKQAPQHLQQKRVDEQMTLGEYLQVFNYSTGFRDHYLVPMGAAIWSASTQVMMNFPMSFFIRFFANHGLLQIKNRPQWFVIDGGSKNYIPLLTEGYKDKIRLSSTLAGISRNGNTVEIKHEDGSRELFDQVIFACHSDEALSLLSDANENEIGVLANMPYQSNTVALHTDESLLPHLKQTWSSWNYRLKSYQQDQATLTYNMNILQGIEAPVTFCVTLNDCKSINPEKILATFEYAHPVFTLDSISAQKRWKEINGNHSTWFCGAYWRNGFHEDGVVSGLRVANGILAKLGKPQIEMLDYD